MPDRPDRRYALYFLPDGDLGSAGATWLGRDCRTGADLDQPPLPGIAADAQRKLTAAPRRYGFHATLKAPMHLAAGTGPADLIASAQSFATGQPPVAIGMLTPRWIGDFLALVPTEPGADLPRFAFDIVRHFEPLRVPLTTPDFARRTEGLPDSLVRNTERWGYPYVGDAFRFHMTLSAPIADPEKPIWSAAAEARFAGILAAPVTIDTLSIAVEDEPGGAFREFKRFALTG